MTAAITRAPAGAAHAHGFAKSLKGDAPSEGFEALFAAVAGAQPLPVAPPVVADAGKSAEHGKPGEGAHDEANASSSAQLIAASMVLVAPHARVVDPRSAPAPVHAQPVSEQALPSAVGAPAPLESARADSTAHAASPVPASQTIVPNAAFAIRAPASHALIAHKDHFAESTVAPAADPPRVTRAPVVPESAASDAKREPVPVGAPVPSHAEAKPLSTASPPFPPQAPAERARDNLSPRALVQAAMVEVVRSPGRGRTPPPDAANADSATAEPERAPAPEPPASVAAANPAAAQAPTMRTEAPLSPLVEEAVIVEAAEPTMTGAETAKPAPSTRAAANIVRQRQFMLETGDASSPVASELPETSGAAFEALIALGKADGGAGARAAGASANESVPPASASGAWVANLPGSPTQAPSAAASTASPRAFDQAAWSAALAQQVAASAVAATRETTVRIKPDGLGPIEVRVRVQSERVDVHFAIEHPITLNMVREALPDLGRMLVQSGLHLGDAQVAQQNAGNRGQAARSDASATQASDEEAAQAIASAVETRPRPRLGLLDDFV